MTLEKILEDFRKQFDELGLKSPKGSMPGLERELIVDYFRKAFAKHIAHLDEKLAGLDQQPTLCGKCELNGKLCKECYANRRANNTLKAARSLLKESPL